MSESVWLSAIQSSDPLPFSLIFLPFFPSERKAHREAAVTTCMLTFRVFPVFQSNPVMPRDMAESHSHLQSVSMFTLVSCKI